MNGLYGLNVRTLGVSRDQIMGDVVKLRPAFMLVHDDPALAALAAGIGIRVIYRASGDDPQGNPLAQSPAVFVQTRADAAPTAAYIHLTNELDPSPALHKWTLEAMQYANRIGRKVCIYNYATNKNREQYESSRANVVYARQHGHAVGIHIYKDGKHDDGAYDGWLSLKREVGGLWIVTEYAPIRSIFDAYTGWRAFMNTDQVSVFMGKHVAFFEREQMPLLWFSYDDWQNDEYGKSKGFGIWREPGLIKRMTALNQLYTYQEATPVTTYPTKPADAASGREYIVTASPSLNVRFLPSTSGARVASFAKGDRVTVYESTATDATGYTWLFAEKGDKRGWIVKTLGTNTPTVDDDYPAIVPEDTPPLVIVRPFRWSYVVTSKMDAPREYGAHEGSDFAPTKNTPEDGGRVRSGTLGVVERVEDRGAVGYGRFVVVRTDWHGHVYRLYYAHLASVAVSVGQQVRVGDVLGVVGSTGFSSGTHLHLTVSHVGMGKSGYVVADVIDPLPLIVDGVIEPEPPPVESELPGGIASAWLTSDEIQQLSELHSEIASIYRRALERGGAAVALAA